MAKILLKNGKIFDGGRFFFGSVLTEDEKIIAIGDFNAEIDAQTTVIDLGGCIVCPGLVDIHVHTDELSGDPYGFPALLETVPFGVTAAVDASANLPPENSAALPIRTAALVSLRVREDGEPDYEAMEQSLSAFGDRALGVKIYFDRGQPFVPALSHIEKTSAFTKRLGLLTMVHCTDSPAPMREIVAALSEGDVLTHAYHGEPHAIAREDYAAYRLAKEKGVVIDAGMAGGVHTDFAVLKNALAQGYPPDVISTDITRSSAYKRGGIYGMTMCMSIYRGLGMDETAVLSAVTSSAAKAARRENLWGALSVGGAADIAVLSYEDAKIDITDRANNRVVLDKGYTCRLTVVNGKILYRNRV